MTDRDLATRIVRVDIEEQHPGLFFGTSPDLRGLFVAKESRAETLAAIPESIAALYQACGERVIVAPTAVADGIQSWVAMPAAEAEAALARLKA